MITPLTCGLSKIKIWKDAIGIECNTKKNFCVLQKKFLSFGPNRTLEVRPNGTFGRSLVLGKKNINKPQNSPWFHQHQCKETRQLYKICHLDWMDLMDLDQNHETSPNCDQSRVQWSFWNFDKTFNELNKKTWKW